ncbi:MAG: prepilin-type N-terminal cleavage/methylation domain-containing protein [Sedimentisphaerales bacterium]|nr:prepilin-type N-terminal cleavage/methylation domain-containing protein [Sedimentisphaerales bacterium]
MRARSGFTLVEILIVVIILGILAAIVIPQFTDASTQARLSSLKSNLQTMRSQIELYKVQHSDTPPSPVGSFDAQMTAVGTDGYGPYLQQVPTNPFNDSNSVAAAAAVGVGWAYDAATGEIQAGDTLSTDGVAHSTW